jgi:hypothetical protein
MFIVFGYGNSQYASHGRPVWNSGKMPAHDTANSVIASANRLIDVRHVCFSSRRIAEISVPAWPMPIHQTKLVMSNAQPTGMLLPQMPMPLGHQIGERDEQQTGEQQRSAEAGVPAKRCPARQDDRADLVGDRAERMPGRDHRRPRGADNRLVRIVDGLKTVAHR